MLRVFFLGGGGELTGVCEDWFVRESCWEASDVRWNRLDSESLDRQYSSRVR